MGLAFIPEIIALFKIIAKKSGGRPVNLIKTKGNLYMFFTAIIILLIVLLYDINYLNYQKPIAYDEIESIELSDFKAIKRPNFNLFGSTQFAYICTDIKTQFDHNKVSITAFFHPSRSYTFSSELASEGLLNHELGHFHITELWKRKIVKAIIEKGSVSKKEIKSIIKSFLIEERAMQKQYDEETFHGYVLGKQKEWEENILSQINKLDNYSNRDIALNN
jgi:hypothetical protein